MKKLLIGLLILGFPAWSVIAAQEADAVNMQIDLTRPNAKINRTNDVVYGQEINVEIPLPAEQNIRLVHKIPSGFVNVTTGMLPGKCSIIKRLNTPALIVCLGIQKAAVISYSAKIPELTNNIVSERFTGFTAAKGTKGDGKNFWFFEKESYDIRSEANTPKPTPSKSPFVSPTASPSPTPVSEIDDPSDIPKHARTLDDPEPQIITDGTDDAIIASAEFSPQNEAIVIKELTAEFTGVNTNALYADVADDFALIDAVSLRYQDGTPVLQTNGKTAKAQGLSAAGKAKFTNLDVAIPESGERLFIAVNTSEMLDDLSGAAFTAAFSFDAGDADIRGFWSGVQLDPVSVDDEESPVQYILANKLTAEANVGQGSILLSGRNNLLTFDLDVSGGDNAFLHSVTTDISKSSSGDGFNVTRLRLRRGSDIIASKTGAGLTGSQTLEVGQCAGGDICNSSEEESEAIFRTTSIVLEAVIEPIGGGLSGSNSMSATIELNGPLPGQDGIEWQDFGSGENDGVAIRWIDPGNSNITRLENTLSNP